MTQMDTGGLLADSANWNADDWHLFLCQHLDNRATSPNGLNTVALKIADTLDKIRLYATGMTGADGKFCRGCKTIKPLDQFDFWLEGRGARKPSPRCKECNLNRYRSPRYKGKKSASDAKLRAEGGFAERDKRHAASRLERHPEKVKAKEAVRIAVASGKLVRPATCEKCQTIPPPLRNGGSAIQGHHDDYSKPLEVRWLCVACHNTHHSREKAA